MASFDILAIGDPVIDNFIKLKDARVNCDINDENCMLSMRFADKIPYESATEVAGVGNAANAAVANARLGLASAFLGYIGDDENGGKIRAALAGERVDTSLLKAVSGKHTNYHFVLWYESERTILIKHELFEYEVPALAEPPKWLYLSSLGENSLPYHAALVEWLARCPDTKLVFQPGTFQMKFGTQALAEVYARADLFFCNKEEAERILDSKEEDPKALMAAMHALGPKTVIITDGRKGAYASDGAGQWLVPMYPDERAPYERTGAGDAFASTVVAALALDKPLEEALLWGPINAMEVVQEVGAQKGLLIRKTLEDFLAKAPGSYTLTAL